MTIRWISIAIALTASAVGQQLVADDAVSERANAPLAISPNAGSPDRSDVSDASSSAPLSAPSAPVGTEPIQDEPLPEQEKQPLGPRPAGDANAGIPQADTDPGWGWGLRTAMALGVVIALVYLARIVLRRMHGLSGSTSSNSSVVEVLARCPVGPRTHVLLLRINERIIVAGQTQAGLNTLAEVDDPDEVAGVLASIEASRPTSITSGFNKLLRQFDRGHQMQSPEDAGTDDAEHLVDRARSDVSSLIGRIRSHGKPSDREDDRL